MAGFEEDDHRWRAHPHLARGLRAAVLLVPLVTSMAAVWLVAGLVPRPDGAAAVIWWAVISLVSTGVLLGSDVILRRLLPLCVLLKLSLLFPDQAPSRFRVAWRSGSSRSLGRWLDEAHEAGRTDDRTRAAETILTLAGALNAHDRTTRGHSERVRAFSDLLAQEMGMAEPDRERLRWAGLLHDIGKLRVEKSVLNKPSKPNHQEWMELRRHPIEGARLAAPLLPWLGSFAPTIEQHHEHFDGSGYPYGLVGEEICLGARIVAVADSFDCMVWPRPYRTTVSAREARAELARGAGAQFDPEVVRAFLNISLGRLRAIIGPLAWLAQIPVASYASTLGERAVSGVASATRPATVAATAAVSAVAVVPLAPAPLPPPAPEAITAQARIPQQAPSHAGWGTGTFGSTALSTPTSGASAPSSPAAAGAPATSSPDAGPSTDKPEAGANPAPPVGASSTATSAGGRKAEAGPIHQSEKHEVADESSSAGTECPPRAICPPVLPPPPAPPETDPFVLNLNRDQGPAGIPSDDGTHQMVKDWLWLDAKGSPTARPTDSGAGPAPEKTEAGGAGAGSASAPVSLDAAQPGGTGAQGSSPRADRAGSVVEGSAPTGSDRPRNHLLHDLREAPPRVGPKG